MNLKKEKFILIIYTFTTIYYTLLIVCSFITFLRKYWQICPHLFIILFSTNKYTDHINRLSWDLFQVTHSFFPSEDIYKHSVRPYAMSRNIVPVNAIEWKEPRAGVGQIGAHISTLAVHSIMLVSILFFLTSVFSFTEYW